MQRKQIVHSIPPVSDQTGASMVEYIVGVAMIALVALAGVRYFGTEVGRGGCYEGYAIQRHGLGDEATVISKVEFDPSTGGCIGLSMAGGVE